MLTKQLIADYSDQLTRVNLAKLIMLRNKLKDRSKWPSGFTWNYASRGSLNLVLNGNPIPNCGCVIGLADYDPLIGTANYRLMDYGNRYTYGNEKRDKDAYEKYCKSIRDINTLLRACT